MKHFILILSLLLSCFCSFSQVMSDVTKKGLNGIVKSVHSYKKDADGEETFYYKTFYNQEGMKTKYISLSYDPDSIEYFYDNKNRLVLEVKHRTIFKLGPGREVEQSEASVDSTVYDYSDLCPHPVREVRKIGKLDEFSGKRPIFDTRYTLDDSCRITEEAETGRGTPQLTTIEFDAKGRKTKRVFAYKNGEEPETVESYEYDDLNRTMKYLEYSPRYNAYREKEIICFNSDNKIIERKYYYSPSWGKSITFNKGNPTEPDSLHLTKKYTFDAGKLTNELHLNGNGEEVEKVEIRYDESGELTEQIFYENKQFQRRETYTYEKGLLQEKKIFHPSPDKLYTVETWKYDDSGNVIEKKKMINKNMYTTQYKYDYWGNEVEKKALKGKKIVETVFTDIEYFQL